MKSIVNGVILFLVVALFYNFVWNGFIVNPSASVALEKKEGTRVALTEIDNKQSLGILQLSDGYQAYALSRGFLGWSVTDDIYLPDAAGNDIFSASKETLEFKRNKEIDIVLVSTQNEDISYFKAVDESNNEIYFDTSRDEGGRELHYAFSKTPLTGAITYEAYSNDDELLYQGEKIMKKN